MVIKFSSIWTESIGPILRDPPAIWRCASTLSTDDSVVCEGEGRLYGEFAKQALADMDICSWDDAEDTPSGRPALSA